MQPLYSQMFKSREKKKTVILEKVNAFMFSNFKNSAACNRFEYIQFQVGIKIVTAVSSIDAANYAS